MKIIAKKLLNFVLYCMDFFKYDFKCWLVGCDLETEEPYNTPEGYYLTYCKRCGREYGFGHYEDFYDGIFRR